MLRCWGRNSDQYASCFLGVGDFGNRGGTPGSMGHALSYVDVRATNGDAGVQQVSIGCAGGCATSALNETKCWGRGDYGNTGGEAKVNVGCLSSDMGTALAFLPVPRGCTVLQVVMA
eukprot:Hpha_TRINITY_DN16940_c5_g1::TRINITY_DN16940_c5_g1_i1::g.56568::m.56568